MFTLSLTVLSGKKSAEENIEPFQNFKSLLLAPNVDFFTNEII
jgi:hypothetical protein